MNAQHSPAPWTLRGDILRDANGVLLYRLTPLDEITIAQDDAIRRLIQHAPELRASLQDLLWMVGPNNANETVLQARALLAKLEGST